MSKPMSDTPRTDAWLNEQQEQAEYSFKDFARTLERELNQAMKQRDEARAALLEAIAYAVNMPGVAAGDEYWTSRMEMAARWRKAAGEVAT